MAKGSGSTRNSQPSSSASAVSAKSWNDIVSNIAKGDSVDFDEWEKLSDSQKEQALLESKFTGLIADDFDMGMLYYSQDKKQFISMLAEDLSNIAGGYDMDDTVNWTIGYADGTRKYLGTTDDDISGSFGVTSNQSFKTQREKVASQLSDNKIAYIIRTDGYDQPRYYVSSKNSGLEKLKEYGWFKEYKDGKRVN